MKDTFRQMQPILAWVTSHLDADTALETLAAKARLSPFHLQCVFSVTMGETPKQLTLRPRLGRPAVLLLTTHSSELDIARNFTRAFSSRMGMRRRRTGHEVLRLRLMEKHMPRAERLRRAWVCTE